MNLRIALVLVMALAVSAILIAWLVFAKDSSAPASPNLPFFYTLSPDDIRSIEIITSNNSAKFNFDKDNRVWYFNDPAGIPVSHERFGGMTFLLGGPKAARVLKNSVANDSDFGLDRPALTVNLDMKTSDQVSMTLGNKTPDDGSHYARLSGYPQLVLIDSSWGDVIARLADEPPFPVWHYKMNPSLVTEILLFEENEVVRGIGFQDEKGWVDCDIPVGNSEPCDGKSTIDIGGLETYLEHIATPEFLGVELVLRNSEQEVDPAYGVDLNAPYLSLRVEEIRPSGVTYVTNVSMTLGKLTPDGNGMYARLMERTDIAIVDAAWGQKILELFHDKSFVQSD